jgi:Archaeal/vacuolar-type H+-ATPase subunit I
MDHVETTMIIPETMAKVQIISLNDVRDRVVNALLKFGLFEPDDITEGRIGEQMDEPKRLLGVLQDHLEKIKLLINESGLLIEPKGSLKVVNWLEQAKLVSEASEKLEEEYRQVLIEVSSLKAEMESLSSKLRELEPFREVKVPPAQLKIFKIMIGYAARSAIPKIREIEGVALVEGEPATERVPVLLIARKDSDVESKIKELGFTVISEIQDSSSPSSLYESIQARLNEITKALEERKSELRAKIREDQDRLASVYGSLLTGISAMRILSKACVSNHFTQFQGYTPLKFVDKLKSMLAFEGVFLTYEVPKFFESKEVPPTYVRLPKAIRPLESIINIYGIPSYWEISPTIFLIVTFPFLFGLMFPDFGNALVIFLFSLWFRNYGKKRGSQNIKQLSLVLLYSSAVAMVTGIFERGFFGPLPIGGLAELLGNESLAKGPLYPIWNVSGLNQVYYFMEPILPTGGTTGVINTILLSILLGAVLLFVSSLLGIINAVKKRDTEWLALEKVPVFLLYTAPFLVFMYGFTNPSDYAGTVGSVLQGILNFTLLFDFDFSKPAYQFAFVVLMLIYVGLFWGLAGKIVVLRKHEGLKGGQAVGIGFIEGMFEPALLLLSNTVSFIRVLVFALAHYYVLFAFSYMAYLAAGTPNSVGAIFLNPVSDAILVIGNLLAIALEGLVVFIQDMRLHFYEMFSKFYEGRGRPFEPAVSYVNLE